MLGRSLDILRLVPDSSPKPRPLLKALPSPSCTPLEKLDFFDWRSNSGFIQSWRCRILRRRRREPPTAVDSLPGCASAKPSEKARTKFSEQYARRLSRISRGMNIKRTELADD